MKIVSDGYKEIAESLDGSARYYHQILVDGVELTDTIVEFKYSHTCNNSTNFSVGNTASAMVEFKIDEPSIDLENKEIEVNQGLKLADGSMEYVKLGIFKVLSPEIERFQATYQCVDAMTYAMATVYESALTYPTTDIAILEEICQQAGIELANTDLVAHTIDKKLDNYTKREMIGFIAQLQGKNAIINDEGKLELIWYSECDYIVDDNRIYSDRIDIVKNSSDYVLGYIKSTYGSKELVAGDTNAKQGIKITNPYMTQEILNEVFDKIKNFTFRALELDFYGDFRLEVGDIVTVNSGVNNYVVPIMSLEQSSDGGVVTTIGSIGETATQNSVDTNGSILNEIKRSVVNSETARSIAEQSADKINFVVEGDSVSEFTISDKALNIISENIDLTGRVTFNSFDEETKDTLSNITEPVNNAEGSPILINDSANGYLIDFKAYGRSVQDGIPTPDAPIEIVSVADNGIFEIKSEGKNLLPYPYNENSHAESGIEWTDVGNGIVIANGSASAQSLFQCRIRNENDNALILSPGTYRISGCPDGGGSSTYFINVGRTVNNSFSTLVNDFGDGSTFTLTEKTQLQVQLCVSNGVSVTDLTFKPLLTYSEITNNDFEPYLSQKKSIRLSEPLRSLGDIKDEIACIDGVYGIIRRIGGKTFDGSSDENWVYENQTSININRKSILVENVKPMIPTSICNRYTYSQSNATNKFFSYSNLKFYFCDDINVRPSVTEWKTWLTNNPLKIVYELIEEVFEPFSDQSIFNKVATFNHITLITATDNPNMWIKYYINSSNGQRLANIDSKATTANITANDVDSTLSSLCVIENNKTVIDGNKIYTGSVTADKIDVNDLFAQNITATGTITGAKLYGASGEFEGDMASYGTVTLYTGSWRVTPEKQEFIKDSGILKLSAHGTSGTMGGALTDIHLQIDSNIDGEHTTYLDLDGSNVLMLKAEDSNGKNGAEIHFGSSGTALTPYTKLTVKPYFTYSEKSGIYANENISSPHIERLMMDKSATKTAYIENAIITSPATINGATSSGNIFVKYDNASYAQYSLKNSLREAIMAINTSGVFGFYDVTNAKWIFYSDTNGNNTINGTTTISGSLTATSLAAKATTATNVLISATNSKRSGGIVVSDAGFFGLWDFTRDKWTIYSDNSDNIYCNGALSVLGDMQTHNVIPITNATASDGKTVGNANFKYRYIYAYSSAIQTSDKNQKNTIDYNDIDKLDKMFDNLKPCTYYMNGGDRKHMGFIAQDVEDAMAQNGMTIDDLSFVCKDKEYKLIEENKPDTEDNREYLVDDNGEQKYIYGLKYTELHALEVNQIQKLKTRVSDLEFALSQALARIEALESKMS